MGRAEDLFVRLEREGVAAIDEMIVTRQAEELYLDFKRSNDEGSGIRLHPDDRNNLSKCISGFGNSEGGVIIWGVDCTPDDLGADVARAKCPLVDAAKFRSWLEAAVSGCTVPPHQGVRSIAIPTVSGGSGGFVATLVPQSNAAPHQVTGGKNNYYIRAGSSFVPAPHAVLAGMFGKRPQPHLAKMITIYPAKVNGQVVECSIGIFIRNNGPGIAKDLFVNAIARPAPGKNCKIGFKEINENFTGNWVLGHKMSLMSKPELRLPPEAEVEPFCILADIAPPFDKMIKIDVILGSGTTPPIRFDISNTPKEIDVVYKELMTEVSSSGPNLSILLSNFSRKLFGLPED